MESSKLRYTFLQASSGSNDILNKPSWDIFTSLLIKSQLLSLEEKSVLEKYTPSFPVTFESTISTLAQIVDSKPEIHQILEHTLNLNSKLLQGKDTFDMWDISSLSQNEICMLVLKLYSDLASVNKAKTLLERSLEKLNSHSEDIQRVVYEKIHDKCKTIETAQVYQHENGMKLDKKWNKEKVRGVQYRSKPIKVEKEYNNGVIKQLGYCDRRDIPVEVVKVPRDLSDHQFLQDFINNANALKQLFLSKYFHKFLGFDDLSDENYKLYFFDILRGVNYKKINYSVFPT